MFAAAQGNGPLLLIRDNKVIGKAQMAIGRGTEWVGIRITEGEVKEEVSKLIKAATEGEDLKDLDGTLRFFFPHFTYYSGLYLDIGNLLLTEKTSEIDAYFQDIRVVNEFNFRWGLVPDVFKDVEGYRSAPSKHDGAVAE